MIGRLRGIVITEMGICETVKKIFAIAREELLTLLRIRLAAENLLEIMEKILEIAVRAGVIAEKIIRIVGEIGVITKGIFGATGITDATTEEVSGVIVVADAITEEISGATGGTEVITEGIFRATEGSGDIIKRISERIVKLNGITNDIIPHSQIIGSDIFQSVAGINIQVDHTEEEAGVKVTDVRFFSVKKKAAT